METQAICLSVVLPCLNEERSLGGALEQAGQLAQRLSLSVDQFEIVVADNGSTDASEGIVREHTRTLPVRWVHEVTRGYGAAVRRGIQASRGAIVLIGDADQSYPFQEAVEIVQTLKRGEADFVIGNRFRGGIEKRAMPFLHRYLGNPVLSFLLRLIHGPKVGDVMCGLRGGAGELLRSLPLKCNGMEQAAELVLASASGGARIKELPFPLRRDARQGGPTHLRRWRDGLRVLTLLLAFESTTRGGARLKDLFLSLETLLFTLKAAFLIFGFAWVGVSFWGYPEPNIHDEFAYLFQAKVFLGGHLSVPEPAGKDLLEGFHLLRENGRWFAKGPPAQPLMLMIGYFLGRPIYGVWLMTLVLSVSLFLVLRAQEFQMGVRSSKPWIFSISALLMILFQSDLIWTYWGGSFSAAFGLLLTLGILGSTLSDDAKPALVGSSTHPLIPRFKGDQVGALGLILASSTGLLLSRPFEGTLLIFLVAIWFARSRSSRVQLAIGFGVGACALLLYQYLLLGRPFSFAQSLYAKRFGDPLWFWDSEPSAPGVTIAEFQRFIREFSLPRWRLTHLPIEFLKLRVQEWRGVLVYWYGGVLSLFGLSLLVFKYLRKPEFFQGTSRRLLGTGVIFFALSFFPLYFFPHYFAPFFGIFWITLLVASRGETQVFPTVVLLMSFIGSAWGLYQKAHFESERMEWGRGIRAPLRAFLERQPGKHLVLVKYGPSHNIHREWVWNEPDVEMANVIWVRWTTGESTKRALGIYSNREVWELTINQEERPQLIRVGKVKVE
jgi:hypothetical protein